MAKRIFKNEYERGGAAALLWPLGTIGLFVLLDVTNVVVLVALFFVGVGLAFFGKTLVEFRVIRDWLFPALGVAAGLWAIASYDESPSVRLQHYLDSFAANPSEAFYVILVLSFLAVVFVGTRLGPETGDGMEETTDEVAKTDKHRSGPMQFLMGLGIVGFVYIVVPILEAPRFERPLLLYCAAASVGIWYALMVLIRVGKHGTQPRSSTWQDASFYVVAGIFSFLVVASGPSTESGEMVPALERIWNFWGVVFVLAVVFVPLILLAIYDRRRTDFQ